MYARDGTPISGVYAADKRLEGFSTSNISIAEALEIHGHRAIGMGWDEIKMIMIRQMSRATRRHATEIPGYNCVITRVGS